MAELITEIISKEAFDQVAKMDADLAKLVKQFEDSARASMLINKALSGASGMKGVSDGIKQTADSTSALEKEMKKLTFAMSDQGKEVVRVRTATAALNAEVREQEKAAINSTNAYKALSNQYIQAAETAKKLGAQLGVNSKEFQTAAALASKYGDQLKAIDAGLGNYKRNVGNYTSATHSLSQVLREMPAFTYSAQTGILALSNNLPILIDQFKAVKAETGSAGSALKIFGKSLMSFPNVLTVAIGLFTIFSKEIFEFMGIASNTSKEVNKLTESIGNQIGKLETLTIQLNDHNLSKEKHLEIAKQLKDEYPTALKNYSLEEIAAGGAANAILKIKDALIAVAMARAAQEDINKLAGEKYEKEKELAAQLAAQISRNANAENAFQRLQKIGAKGSEAAAMAAERGYDIASKGEGKIKALTEDISSIDGKMSKAVESINKYSTAASAAGIGMDGKDVSKTATKTNTGKKKSEFKLFSPREEMDDLAYLKELNEQIDKLISGVDEAFAKAGIGKGADIFDGTMPGEGTTDQQAQELQQQLYMQGLHKHLGEIEKLKKQHRDNQMKLDYDAMVKMLNDVKQVADSVTSIMNDLSQLQYDREMSKIEERDKMLSESYDNEIKKIEQSGKSKEQIEKDKMKLEAQTEAQRKIIDKERAAAARKKAQVDRASDIVNIISGTALAVVNALGAKPYTPANIALAAAAGATGAAQLARAIATPLPSYAKGTQNHKGGFAQVGEVGQELVVEPSGKKYLTPSKPTIMHLPQGTKVIPHNELINSAKNSAYVKLANGNTVTSENYALALIESFEENNSKMDKLIRITENKRTSATVNFYGGFNDYVKQSMM